MPVMNKESYQKFCDIINFLSSYCLELHIREGNIRCLSDNKTMIFDLRLPDEMSELSLSMVGLNTYIKDLVPHFIPEDDTDTVFVDVKDDSLILEKSDTRISLRLSNPQILYNRYLTLEQLNQNISLDMLKPGMILEVSDEIMKRITAFKKILNCTLLFIEYKDGKACIKMSTKDKGKGATFNIQCIEPPETEVTLVMNSEALKYPFSKNVQLHAMTLNGTYKLIKITGEEDQIVYSFVKTLETIDGVHIY